MIRNALKKKREKPPFSFYYIQKLHDNDNATPERHLTSLNIHLFRSRLSRYYNRSLGVCAIPMERSAVFKTSTVRPVTYVSEGCFS